MPHAREMKGEQRTQRTPPSHYSAKVEVRANRTVKVLRDTARLQTGTLPDLPLSSFLQVDVSCHTLVV